MKIMITYPPIESGKGFPLLSQNRQFQFFSNSSTLFPVVPASAATLLKSRGYDVIWKDAISEGISWQKYAGFIRKEKPDLIAIETKAPVVRAHWKIISRLKKECPSAKFILMGDHVTSFPEESMKKCRWLDFVITGGDYDFMLLGLCRHLKGCGPMPKGVWYRKDGKIKNTGKFELKHSLDELPFIDRKLTRCFKDYTREYNIRYRPFAYIMSGRDCPWHKCKFCAWPVMYPAFRARSPENVLDEIGMLTEKYGVKEVFDDTGTFPPGAWLREFCEGMISRGYNKRVRLSCNMRVDYITPENAKLMKRAGFRLLKMGLESANQKTLDRINKGIRVSQISRACTLAKKAGLEVHLTMIVGYPWETKQDALRTVHLAKRLMTSGMADVLQATVLVPYPGTALHREGIENKWFRFDPNEYERYDMGEPVFKTPDMSADEVVSMCNNIYRIFTSPKYIVRHLFKIRRASDIKYTLKGLKAVLGHRRDFSGR